MSGAVETALRCLGRGFDVACDFRPEYCRGKQRLLVINEEEKREIAVPGFGTLKDVSVDIKCDKGDRIRYQSDVLEFNQMSELFNHRSSMAGKIPSGLFNYMFDLDGRAWAQEASNTKCLAIDGYFITLLELRIEHHPLALADHVVRDVPLTWDPCAIARFIETYGTHIIMGLSVGGQDVVSVKQDHSSSLSACELRQHLERLGDQLFTGKCALPPFHRRSKEHELKVPEAFNVFDLQKQNVKGIAPVFCKDLWAPMHNDLPLGPISNRSIPTPALRFTLMGPELYVNSSQVLAIHLEHLSHTPAFIGARPEAAPAWRGSDAIADERYYEPVRRKKFALVCTVPIECDTPWDGGGAAFVVTGAQLHVTAHESTSVLHLRLLYSEVRGCVVSRSQWRRRQSGLALKSSFFSAVSASFSGGLEKERHEAPEMAVDSGIFPAGPPVPVGAQKLLKFVDTSHLCQGPQHSPGHWLVTGAKLDVEKGRIGLQVKFSLLTSLL
ncbi:hypothetical protein BHE74_00041121 [Ensete ventricosum]|nr:hypothetical protein BHE74_00041121 [Ensete ventricosum]